MSGITYRNESDDCDGPVFVDSKGQEYSYVSALVEENLSKELILLLIATRETLEELAHDYFNKRYKADSDWQKSWEAGSPYSPCVDNIDIDEDTVDIECSGRQCSRGCCGTHYQTFTFPTSYLWLDQESVLADMTKAKEAAAQQLKEEKEKRAMERKIRDEIEERATLARLKRKYASG